MERIQGLDEATIAQLAADYLAAYVDDDLPPEDRRNRLTDETLPQDKRVVCEGSYIKVGDDVSMNGFDLRVACAARDRNYYMGYTTLVPFLLPCAAADATDRAPIDPNEAALPIMIPLPDEEPSAPSEPATEETA